MGLVEAARRRGAPERSGLLLCAVGLFVLAMAYLIAVLTVTGQRWDDEIFGLAQRAVPGPLGKYMPFIGRRLVPVVLLLALVVAGGLALTRQRWGDVLQGATILLMSVPTSRTLREMLPRPDHGYSYDLNTMPSTHVTLAAATAVAIVVVWPGRRPEGLVAVLVVGTALAAAGSVIGHAHRPSDVVASVALVAACAGGVQWGRAALDRNHDHD